MVPSLVTGLFRCQGLLARTKAEVGGKETQRARYPALTPVTPRGLTEGKGSTATALFRDVHNLPAGTPRALAVSAADALLRRWPRRVSAISLAERHLWDY